jgi:hypothetical protein
MMIEENRMTDKTPYMLATALALLGSASAAMVETKIEGHIETISPPLQGRGVQVGNTFSLALTFDDTLGVKSEVTVGGTHYFLMTDSFSTGMQGWHGSLPTFLASRYPSETSSVTKQSWFRPLDTLHHEEWSLFGMLIITNYSLNPGGENYGWYGYGDPANIEFSIDHVVTTSVPELPAYALMLAGLGIVGFGTRSRKPTSAPPRPECIAVQGVPIDAAGAHLNS